MIDECALIAHRLTHTSFYMTLLVPYITDRSRDSSARFQFDSSRPRFRLVSASAQPTAAVRMGILIS